MDTFSVPCGILISLFSTLCPPNAKYCLSYSPISYFNSSIWLVSSTFSEKVIDVSSTSVVLPSVTAFQLKIIEFLSLSEPDIYFWFIIGYEFTQNIVIVKNPYVNVRYGLRNDYRFQTLCIIKSIRLYFFNSIWNNSIF